MAITRSGSTITVNAHWSDSGTATGATSTTLTDSTKSWTTNQWAGRSVWIHSGTGAGQSRRIISNTATVLTIDSRYAFGLDPWQASNPASGSGYKISCSWADIHAASVAGSWGLTSNPATNVYVFACNIIINGASFLASSANRENVSITGQSGGTIVLDVVKGSRFQLGYLDAGYAKNGGLFQLLRGALGSNAFTSGSGVGDILIYGMTIDTDNFWQIYDLPTLSSYMDFVDNTFTSRLAGSFSKGVYGRWLRNRGVGDRTFDTKPGFITPVFDTISEFSITNSNTLVYWASNNGNFTPTLRDFRGNNVGALAYYEGATNPAAGQFLDIVDLNPLSDCFDLATPVVFAGGTLNQANFPTVRLQTSWFPYTRVSGTYESGFNYRIADSGGTERINTSNSASPSVQTISWREITPANAITNRYPFSLVIRKYGRVFQALSRNFDRVQSYLNDSNVSAKGESIAISTNPYTTASSSANALAVTNPTTANQIYDHAQATYAQSGNLQYTENITTTNGQTLAINLDTTIDSGLSAVAYNFASGSVSYSAVSVGTFTGFSLGASKTLTLAQAATYSAPWSIPATGTVVVASGTTDLRTWTFASGATINRTSGTAVVIVDADQVANITEGTGVEIQRPPVTLTASQLTSATFNNVRCRLSLVPGGPVSVDASTSGRQAGGINFTTSDVNTSANTITLTGINGKINSNTVIRFFGTDLPQPLDARAAYYPSSSYSSGNNLSVSNTIGGTAIDLTDVGSGSDMYVDLWTQLDIQLITSGSYTVDLTAAATTAGVAIANNDILVLQACHWAGDPQSVSPCVASEYLETAFVYSGSDIPYLGTLELAAIHNQFCVQRAKDGSKVTEFILDPSTPGKVQLDTGVSAFRSEDAALFFYYIRHTTTGIKLLRDNFRIESINEIKVVGQLTIDSAIRSICSGSYIYRADGGFLTAVESAQIEYQFNNPIGVVTEVDVPVDLSEDVIATLASILAKVASSSGSGLDAAGVRSAIGLASANLDTQLDSIPTVAELNARTLPSANYFDPASDSVTVGAIADNTITAASIASNAIDSDVIAASAVSEIQSGLASSSAVAAIPTNPLLVNDPRLDNLDATVSSRSTYSGSDTAGTTTLLSRLTSGRASNLDNLDSAISSRLAASSYTAPDNAGITAIKAKTDNLPASPASTSDVQVTVSGGFTNSDRSALLAIPTNPLLAPNYTAPDNSAILAIKAKTDQLAFASGRVDAEVWSQAIEDSLTARQILQALTAIAIGKTAITPGSNGNATVVFRNPGDTINRIAVQMEQSERVNITTTFS